MGHAARMFLYIVPAALMCMLYGDSGEQHGRAAYRTAPETGSLIVKMLEEGALSPSEVPPELRERLRYFDFDQDGLLESRIAWDNDSVADCYILMERDGKRRGHVKFPELAIKAVRPLELPGGIHVDYRDIGDAAGIESVIYMSRWADGRQGKTPYILEYGGKGKYYCRELTRGGNDGGRRHLKKRPPYPVPLMHSRRPYLARR
jgi:hypothetical protein